jgi:nucleotide-binding universal stress UspA family protein
MKKILVPCDFSNQAIDAFRMALDVAKQSDDEIHLINVIEMPVMQDTLLMPTLSFEEALFMEMKANAENQFQKIREQYAKGFNKVNVVSLYGVTAFTILNYITEHKIALVVMGSRGSSGMAELLVGSNAEKIVRRSPVPVLVVKKYEEVTSIKNIVFPSTLEHDHNDLVSQVKMLQDRFKATLHILYVNTPNRFKRDSVTKIQLQDFAKKFTLKDFTLNVHNDTDEESGIINFTHLINADMIAMGTHGRKGLAHILSGSVTEDVVNHVDCPIWTYTIKD